MHEFDLGLQGWVTLIEIVSLTVEAHGRVASTPSRLAVSPARLSHPLDCAFFAVPKALPGVPPPSGFLLRVPGSRAAGATRTGRRGAMSHFGPPVTAPARATFTVQAIVSAPVPSTPL